MKPRLTTILLMFVLTLQVSADNLGYTKETPLVFGIDRDYPPMQYLDANGNPQGFDVEFFEELMKRMNIPFTYSPNTWENIADDILKGRVDLGMMVYSPYRKDVTNFSYAVFRLYYQLVTRRDAKRMYGLRDVAGKKFALMRSRPIIDTLTKVGAQVHVIENLSKAMTDLSDGKYDAVICFRYQSHYFIEKLQLSGLMCSDLALTPREYCYVSHDKRLIDAINVELEKMDTQEIIDEVYDEVKTNFGEEIIPRWVWWLLGGLIIAALSMMLFLQRRNSKLMKEEMERAQKSEELKDIFLSNISHALRTPLNAIIGFSDLLMNSPRNDIPEEEEKHLLDLINFNGLQLLHLINELLSLSDIEGKSQLFDRQVTDIDAEMSSYAAEIRPQLDEGVALEVVEPVGGMRALLDPKLLRVVTMHLLENAQQHTKEGKVTLTYYVKEGGIYVEVKDTGSGLPDKLKANIFALLSDKNTYMEDDAPGLGLSICKAIVDRTGGKMGASDNTEDGRGTIVWFWAPTEILL